MANLSDIITPTNLVTLTGTDTLTNKTLTSPVLTTPALGTPSALVLTNATGTVTNLTLVTPALGTPASGVMTSVTGLPLTTGVTGTLPVANGGTGATTLTANNVLLGNGTSAPQAVAPSTSGNVLTSNGSTWASTAPAAGGSMVWLSTVTASASSTVDIETTFDSTYDAYVVLVTALKTSISTTINGRVKIGSYITTAGTYLYHLGECTTVNGGYIGTAFSTGAGKTNFEFTNNIGTGADHSVDLRINIFDPSSTSTAKKLFWEGISKTGGNELARISAGGGNTNTGALTGIRFFPGAGTITSGTFRLYGITNS